MNLLKIWNYVVIAFCISLGTVMGVVALMLAFYLDIKPSLASQLLPTLKITAGFFILAAIASGCLYSLKKQTFAWQLLQIALPVVFLGGIYLMKEIVAA